MSTRIRFARANLLWPIAALLGIVTAVYAQHPAPIQFGDSIRAERNVTRSSISEQRVMRQTEVMRLERMIERLETRVSRLERHLHAADQLSMLSVDSAKNRLRVAESALAQMHRNPPGEGADERQLEEQHLAIEQAQHELRMATAADAERIALLELDLSDAERRALDARREYELLERLTARGLATGAGLRLKQTEVDRANNELQLARLRLNRRATTPESSGTNAER